MVIGPFGHLQTVLIFRRNWPLWTIWPLKACVMRHVTLPGHHWNPHYWRTCRCDVRAAAPLSYLQFAVHGRLLLIVKTELSSACLLVKTNSNSSIARLNWVHVNSDWSLSSVNPWVIGGTVVWRADTWIIFFISIFVLRSNKYLVMWHLPERHLPEQACYENCENTHTHTQTIYRLTQTQNTTASIHILRSSDTSA